MSWKTETIRAPQDDPFAPADYLITVVPNDDLIQHSAEDWKCACGPKRKDEIGIHGCTTEVICVCTATFLVHNSLDGRELSE